MSMQPANQRTWYEDILVIAVLFCVMLGSMAVIGPTKQAPLIAPAPIELAVTNTSKRPWLPQISPDSDPVLHQPVIEPRDLPLPVDQLIPSQAAFITLFGVRKPAHMWHRAVHDNNRHWLTDFRDDNIVGTSEGLSLTVTKKSEPSLRPWNGGEISSYDTYGYGRYETIMKPALGSGLVSGFFTYTGPYFGTDHDEIDFEFLGKNPRQVELNMWRDQVSYASKVIDLPFDATADFHLYAFEWRPDEVVWYIDGIRVHRVSKEDFSIPVTPGKIYLNIWTGTLRSWHGPASFRSGVSADYACVSYRPIGEKARTCADFYTPSPGSLRIAATE